MDSYNYQYFAGDVVGDAVGNAQWDLNTVCVAVGNGQWNLNAVGDAVGGAVGNVAHHAQHHLLIITEQGQHHIFREVDRCLRPEPQRASPDGPVITTRYIVGHD